MDISIDPDDQEAFGEGEHGLREVYRVAEDHVGRHVRDDHRMTFEEYVWVNGSQVNFHIDNTAAIYIDAPSGNDLVYVYVADESQAVDKERVFDASRSDVVTEDEFVDRVLSMV